MIQYRRFAEMFEFDRNGPPLEGTYAQQQTIRGLLADLAPHGSRLWQTIRKVDLAINRKGRHFIPISFVDFTSTGLLGFTFPSLMQLHYEINPNWLDGIFLHELGHVVGWHGVAPVDTSERWANDFHQWVESGCPEAHPVWERIAA